MLLRQPDRWKAVISGRHEDATIRLVMDVLHPSECLNGWRANLGAGLIALTLRNSGSVVLIYGKDIGGQISSTANALHVLVADTL